MNIQTIQEYLQSQIHIANTDIEALEHLVQQYPWFSIGQQLLLKAYKENNNQKYAELSRIAPLYALSRRRLFLFLETKPIEDSQIVELDLDKPIESIPQVEQEKIKKNTHEDLSLTFNNEFFSLEQFDELDEQAQHTHSDELIAKFIQTNPRIIPKIVNQDNKVENIETIKKEEPASEMLAEIYTQQGLYDLAIACYEKLCLQNPQKSSYFAELIDRVNERKLK